MAQIVPLSPNLVALLGALCFVLSSQLAFAADDIGTINDRRLACNTTWQACLQNCQGNEACVSNCTSLYAICIVDTAKSEQSPLPGEIRTGAGLCLDAHAPQMAVNGGRVQAWACNGQRQQRWTYHPTERAVRISSGLCLDVHAPQMTTNGGRVQVWACNGALQQQWAPLKNGALRNASGLCLDVHAADQTKNGARVQVWQCNGSLQQRFTMVAPSSSSIQPQTGPVAPRRPVARPL